LIGPSSIGLASFAKRLVEHAINLAMSSGGVSILADMGSSYLFNNNNDK
jgi:hypothetical protein